MLHESEDLCLFIPCCIPSTPKVLGVSGVNMRVQAQMNQTNQVQYTVLRHTHSKVRAEAGAVWLTATLLDPAYVGLDKSSNRDMTKE